MAWLGAPDHEKEFLSLFGRVITRLTADDFLAEGSTGVLRDVQERALKRGVHLSDDAELELDTLDHTQFLTAGQVSRLRALEACRGQSESIAGPRDVNCRSLSWSWS